MFEKISKLVTKNKLILLVILLAAILRFVAITQNPPSLNWDEVSHGYNAYSILKTGKDEWGVTLPGIFRAYGDYKLPVYIYVTAISEAIFGLNAFAVRLPSILAGIATVIFTYLLVYELFRHYKNQLPVTRREAPSFAYHKQLAIVAALLVAVEPWSLFLSRAAFEANLALALFVSGLYFFIKGLHNSKFLLYASIFLGLTVWMYNSYRIFTPLLLAFLIFIYREKLKNTYRNSPITSHQSLITLAIFLLPMFYQLLNPIGQARYGWVAILDEGTITQINEYRARSDLSPGLNKVVYNKGTFFISKFVQNWASHYTGVFLFFKGGSHYQFSIPGHGLLYPVNAIFLIIGVLYLLKRRTNEALLILGWFYFGPVASSLTREAPHVLRSITMLPAPMIISSVGLVSTYNWLSRKIQIPISKFQIIVVVSYLVVLTGFVESYMNVYFTKYRSEYSWSWQYGYRQVVDYVKNNYEKYDKIIVTKKYGEPHEFFLFYWPWDPEDYRNDPNLIRFYQSNWYWVDGFDKFYFVNDWEIPATQEENFVLESGGKVECMPRSEALRGQMSNLPAGEAGAKCLLITSPENFPGGWDKLETINFLDGQPAFEIYKN